MREVKVCFYEIMPPVQAGVAGENLSTVLTIDVKPVLAEWPDAFFSVFFLRRDEPAYVAAPDLRPDGNGFIRYALTNVETALPGLLVMEIQARRDGGVAKSWRCDIIIAPSLCGPPPPPQPNWLDEFLEIAHEVNGSVESAAQSAASAEADAGRAEAARDETLQLVEDFTTREKERVQAESERIIAEDLRAGAEEDRETAEGLRAAAEQDRTEAEGLREAAEQDRAAAEDDRAALYDQVKTAYESGAFIGEQGVQGETGPHYTPAVDASCNLSWTNNGGLANPAAVNIKGETGATGAPGQDGAPGKDGAPGEVTQADFDAHRHNDLIHVSEMDRFMWNQAAIAKRYGIRWDRVNSKCTRLWDAEDITVDTSNFGHFGSANARYDNPFDFLYPWSHRRLCNVDLAAYAAIYTAGGNIMDAITAWEGEPGFAYNGSNGAVMVYTPVFWAYMERGEEADTYGVANMPVNGWTRMEASIGGRYFGSQDGQGGITSVAGGIAWRGAVFSLMAQTAKANKIALDDMWTWCADTLLLCVEYATLNSQAAVGNGCDSLSLQGNHRPLTAETGANRVIAPVVMQTMASKPGAVLDIGTTTSSMNVATRAVISVEEYASNPAYVIIHFAGDPVNILTSHFLSIHGCANTTDAEIGSLSGYIGENGYCNAYYRGRVAHANYSRIVLGAYRQAGTLKIWMAHDRKEALESGLTLNTAKHLDTGLVLPGLSVTAYISALHFCPGMPLAPFASAATGGDSIKPVGDYVSTPDGSYANTFLYAGGSYDGREQCGRFYGGWSLSESGFSWRLSLVPFLLMP